MIGVQLTSPTYFTKYNYVFHIKYKRAGMVDKVIVVLFVDGRNFVLGLHTKLINQIEKKNNVKNFAVDKKNFCMIFLPCIENRGKCERKKMTDDRATSINSNIHGQ